jgi:deazaflavin-dependent oxidoreductase (nitroreductase family)
MSTAQPNDNRALREMIKPVNRVMTIFAGFLLYAKLEHRGRTSGRTYQTPVVAWPVSDGVIIPMPYGIDTDWHKNIKATGGCTITLNGKTWNLDQPRLITRDEALIHIPLSGRMIVQLTRIENYLRLTSVGSKSSTA